MRVYIIGVNELWEYMEDKYGKGNYTETFSSVSDEDYKSACAKYGWDLSLEQFVSEFNADGDYAPTNEKRSKRAYDFNFYADRYGNEIPCVGCSPRRLGKAVRAVKKR